MARKKKAKRIMLPDPIYNNINITKLINYVMEKGKKEKARKIVYGSFDIIKNKTQKDPVEIFEKALVNASPLLEVRSKRIGGATYQVPREVRGERKLMLALRWILQGTKGRKGKTMKEKLVEELIDAANNQGWAVKKRDDTHKMAEANRAFAHFAR